MGISEHETLVGTSNEYNKNANWVAGKLESLETECKQKELNERHGAWEGDVRCDESGAMTKEQQAHRNGGDRGDAQPCPGDNT